MNGKDFKQIRKDLGLSVVKFGRAIGYEGANNSVSTTVRRYEANMRDIPPWIGRLATMFKRFGVPDDFLK